MGGILSAKCKCGFNAGDLYLGGGRQNFSSVCSAPAMCASCQKFSVLNYIAKRPRCPSCRRSVTFYNDESLRVGDGDGRAILEWRVFKAGVDKFVLPNTTYKCPSCGEMRLRFSAIGHWD